MQGLKKFLRLFMWNWQRQSTGTFNQCGVRDTGNKVGKQKQRLMLFGSNDYFSGDKSKASPLDSRLVNITSRPEIFEH